MKNKKQDAAMNMFRLLPVILCVFIYAGLLSCAGTSLTEEMKNAEPGDRGFIDDDTFWMKESGSPEAGLNYSEDRKKSSKESAIKKAQYSVYESFAGRIIESGNGMCNIECIRKFIKEKYGNAIKNGTVIYEKYDSDENCEIIYVIKAPGLKNHVRSCSDECSYPN